MSHALSCEQIRRLDSDAILELHVPSLLLMENAARGTAEIILREGPWTSITIICGPGNNGGDGLALARLLAADSVACSVWVLRGDKLMSSDAQANLEFLQRSGLLVREGNPVQLQSHLNGLCDTDLLVDALLGTGIRGKVRSPFSEVIDAINACPAQVMSLDVPSGLDCDSGTACGTAVKADRTVTFAAMKKGFLIDTAAAFTGKLTVCHIGLPATWIDAWHRRIDTMR